MISSTISDMTTRVIFLLFALYALLSVSTQSALATVITFEDSYFGGSTPISNPYNGLVWNNFYPISNQPLPSGYAAALLSGSTIVFNGNGGDGDVDGDMLDATDVTRC